MSSSYIGRSVDAINNISSLDVLTFNGSDATFNLTQNSVAFVPVSADALQIQIDGVIQSGNYTVSGSTVTFDFTPSGSSVCNGIRHFGVGLLTTVSDSSITTAKLGADSVTNTKVANSVITGQTAITSLADTDKFLVSDASDSGNLKYVEKQYLGGGAFNLISATAVTDSVTAFNIANVFSSSYQMYMMIVQNVRVTADCNIRLRFGASGTYHSSGYRYVGIGRDRSGVDRSYNGTGDTSMLIVKELDGNDGLSHAFGVYYFANPNISATNSNRKRVTGHYTVANAAGNSTTTTYNFAGELEVSGLSADGIRLFVDAGNFRGGVAGDGDGMIKIYGIADS